jgi:Na+/H+ antiporter NhaD/arsenite permease-like protein
MKDATVQDYFPTWLLGGMVGLLILASFIPGKISITNGLICVGLFVVGLIRQYFIKKDHKLTLKAIKEIDYFTIMLLAGLFVVIGGITETGLINDISRIFVGIGNNNLFIIFTVIVWASVFFSAFIDNIPYVATMLPVVGGIAAMMNIDPNILYFGLLTGATLGGNLTPIGASANIAALGILRKEGYQVSAWQFMKIGIPFTMAAVITGYLMIWFIWR